jgi:methyl-accepting chemotaxis protein
MELKDFFTLNTISRKFLIPTVAYLVLLLGVLGTALVLSNSATINSVYEARSRSMTDFLGKIGLIYINYYDIAALEGFVNQAINDPELTFVVFYDSAEKPLTTSSVEPDDISSLLVEKSEILNDSGEVLGYIKLGYSKEKLSRSRNVNILTMVFGGIVAIFLFSLGTTWILKGITGPLRTLSLAANRLRSGDLSFTLNETDREDEVGVLQNAFRSMAENIRSMLENLQTSINQLASNTAQISSTAKQAAATSAEQASTVAEVSTTIEEINQTSKATSESSKDVVRVSEEVIDKGMKGADAVVIAVKAIEAVATKIDGLSAKIMELSSQNEQIGSIVNSVNDLAEQSNLLAVNASIEAAKAGEQGRGFAVVASEVRNLAEQSKGATRQIRDILRNVQKATESAILMAEESTKVSTEGREAIDSVRSFMNDLSMAISENVDQATRISGATTQQAIGISQIAEAMEAVAKGGEDTASGARQLENAVMDISHLTEQIKEVVARFERSKE